MMGKQGGRFSRSDTGLLIVGHGTRQPGGTAEFLETVAQVGQRLPGVVVQPCFLEFSRPTITEGVEQLARQRGTAPGGTSADAVGRCAREARHSRGVGGRGGRVGAAIRAHTFPAELHIWVFTPI